MKKKLISMALCAACVLGTSAFAEVTPKVFVDGCEVVFTDQAPVIENDRTLIPLRGALEATGARVNWYPTTQKIQVQSHDYWRLTELVVGSDIMKVSKFQDGQYILNADTTEVKLDDPIKVVNDRTLIPLRAVAESFLYDTVWNDEDKTVTITTDRTIPTAEDAGIYLTTDKEDVNAGDTFDVLVNIKNFTNEQERVINGATIGLIYDKDKLELTACDLYNGDKQLNGLGSSNGNFSEDSLKTATVTVDYDSCLNTDGVFYKLTFKALTDEGGSVSLSKRYNSKLGYDTTVLVSKDTKSENLTPMDLYIDTTPLVVK